MKLLPVVVSLLVLVVLGCANGERLSGPTTHRIRYEVTATINEASVTYRTSDGGTEQADINPDWSKEFTAHSGDFLYISAQNKKEYGEITTKIIVDGNVAKKATSKGGFVIATSSIRCCE